MNPREKGKLRTHYASRRDNLSSALRQRHSERVGRMISRLLLDKHVSRVMLYAGKGGELDVLFLVPSLEAEGICCYLPSTRQDRITVARYDGMMPLVKRTWGIREPEVVCAMEPSLLDVVVVPGVAFDERGGRLGHGGGYYDRLFQETDALRIGICHAVQISDGLPMASHDVYMDMVLTEKGMLYTGDRGWKSTPIQ